MMIAANSGLFRTITRVLGIALSVTGAIFHRRGLLDWREPAFILVCIALQELFLVLPMLRKLRPYLLAFYLMLPALFVLLTLDRIEPHRGDPIALALYTPLPLLLLPIQLMVLYTREAPRLSSLVIVLTLFYTVAGLRRPMDDLIWPWMLAIAGLAALYMACCYPMRLHLQMFPIYEGRSFAPPIASPAGLMRGSFFGVLWAAIVSSFLVAATLFLVTPRVYFSYERDTELTGGGSGGPGGRGTGGGGTNPGEPSGGTPRDLSTVSALSNRIELGDFGEIKQSSKPALEVQPTRVTTPTQVGPPIYLRAFTHARFENMQWSPLPSAARDTLNLVRGANGKRPLPGARRARTGWRATGYKVTVLNGGLGENGELPVPADPTALLTFEGTASWDSRGGILRAPELRKGGAYGAEALEISLTYSEIEDLAAGKQPLAPPPANSGREPVLPYWELPSDLFDLISRLPVYEETRSRLTRGPLRSAAHAARWLQSYFHNETRLNATTKFRYSLVQRPEPGRDAIYRFLTDQPYGHCEYFATAMCMVLRAAGIPCRLAAGYHASQFNRERGIYEVKASDAHAWVEVFVQDIGWVRYDPTPARQDSETPTQPDVPPDPTPEPVVDTTKPEPKPENTPQDPESQPAPTGPRDPLVNFDRRAQEEMMGSMTDGLSNLYDKVQSSLEPLVSWMPGFLPRNPIARAALLLVPAAAIALAIFFKGRKRRKLERKVMDEMGLEEGLRGATRRQQSLYLSLLLTLAPYGFHKRPFETPREFAWRVARRGGSDFAAVANLTEIFYRIRFAALADERQEEAVFKRLLSAFAMQLRRAVSSQAGPVQPEAESAA